jgi:hypothetical protein
MGRTNSKVRRGIRVTAVATAAKPPVAYTLVPSGAPAAIDANIAMPGKQPVGVDLSPGMIDLARNTNLGIDFQVADVEHLPFADGLMRSSATLE